MNTVTVDARCLLCPLPVIRTQEQVARLHPGDFVRVLCTDPGVLHDIPSWCRLHGHKVADTSVENDEIAFTIEVGDSD